MGFLHAESPELPWLSSSILLTLSHLSLISGAQVCLLGSLRSVAPGLPIWGCTWPKPMERERRAGLEVRVCMDRWTIAPGC